MVSAKRSCLPIVLMLALFYRCECLCPSPSDSDDATVCLRLRQYLQKTCNASVKGDKGIPGKIGPIGPKGEAGRQGSKGEAGRQGQQGAQGAKGEDSTGVFYVLMSPSWLARRAQFTETPAEKDTNQITFRNGTTGGQLFKAPIISPGKMAISSSVIVTIKFLYERVTIVNDLLVGICDTTNCIGFNYPDSFSMHSWVWSNPPSNNNCWVLGGLASGWSDSTHHRYNMRFELTSTNSIGITWPDVAEKNFLFSFNDVLNPATGLWIMTCRDQSSEVYGIRFFEAAVWKNGLS